MRVSGSMLDTYLFILLKILRPDVRYMNETKNNPALRGWRLAIAALLFVILLLSDSALQLRNICPGWSG